jgi:hypothetical protein
VAPIGRMFEKAHRCRERAPLTLRSVRSLCALADDPHPRPLPARGRGARRCLAFELTQDPGSLLPCPRTRCYGPLDRRAPGPSPYEPPDGDRVRGQGWDRPAWTTARRPSAKRTCPNSSACTAALRPTRSRSAMTSRWFMVSNKPLSRHRANQRDTVVRGGRSRGRSRHATPPRSTEKIAFTISRNGHVLQLGELHADALDHTDKIAKHLRDGRWRRRTIIALTRASRGLDVTTRYALHLAL